jgi:hypothetical protein
LAVSGERLGCVRSDAHRPYVQNIFNFLARHVLSRPVYQLKPLFKPKERQNIMKNNTHLTVVGLFGLFLLLLSASVQSASATEYLVRVDGAVSTVSVNYNASATSGTVKATVPAGYSFDPTTGIVVPTTSTYLQNLIADIDTVKNTRRPLKSPAGKLR